MVSDDSAVESSGDATNQSREQGVDIGSLAEELEDHSYPATNEELLSEYGDHEVDLMDGSKSVEDILGKIDGEEQTYDSADEVRQMIYNMVGADAVGREGYSDRGGIAGDSDTTDEHGGSDSDPESL